ncbi:MAG: hypothetical protein CMJ18_00305 [Phycisphaeraceae bacterium]|nr:hypothetical protein [Phycisphaeraceae bacterium]
MKVAVVGLGGPGEKHARHITDSGKADVVAFVDIESSKAEAAARQYGAVAFTDVEEMLDQSSVDAVFLCTPPWTRTELIPRIARRGLALFCEKPPARTLADADRCRTAIEQAGIINSVGFMYRWAEVVHRMRELLEGRPVNCCMVRGIWTVLFWDGLPGWYFDKRRSGGAIVDQGVHLIDAVRYVLQDDVTSVHAFADNLIVPKTESTTVEDTVSINLRFARGTLGTYAHVWAHRGWVWQFDCIGEDFYLTCDLSLQHRLSGYIGDEKVDLRTEDDCYVTEIERFLDAVAANDQSVVRSSYADSIRSLAAALAINESMDTGGMVEVS